MVLKLLSLQYLIDIKGMGKPNDSKVGLIKYWFNINQNLHHL